MKKINTVVMGKSGVGKSTIVNSILGEELAETGIGKPVTEETTKFEKDKCPFLFYDTKGLELEEKENTIRNIENIIRERAKTEDPEEFIHYIWYCINARTSRIEEYEIDLIKKLSKNTDIIIVLTQAINDNAEILKEEIKRKDLPILDAVPILALKYEFTENQKIERYGLEELIDLSFINLDKAKEKTEKYASILNLDKKAEFSRKIIKKHIKLAFATGIAPIPFQDAFLLVPNQVAMIKKINDVFKIEIDKKSIRFLISGILGTMGATFVGKTIVSNAFKFIPGIGTVAGGAISASTASLLTKALGYSYIEVLSLSLKRKYSGDSLELNEFSDKLKSLFVKNLKILNREEK